MKTKIALILALTISTFAYGQTVVGIASGQPTGTNHPMAQDIVKVCSTPAMTINNIISDGSLDNIYKVHGDRNSQYGIVQADALIYQQGIDKKMMDKIVMVFPFFSTEVHLIAKEGSKINSLADLAGKKVVEGPEGSGTWVTVQVIKSLTGLQWTTIIASQAEGLKMVQTGQADVEFIVAGKPIKMLESAQGIKLIPVSNSALDKFALYTPTMIQTGVYTFQKSAIKTIKVDNILATYTYKTNYQNEIYSLVSCITKNIDWLQSNGHPKWKDVNPVDIDRIKWPSHPAAVKAIKANLKPTK